MSPLATADQIDPVDLRPLSEMVHESGLAMDLLQCVDDENAAMAPPLWMSMIEARAAAEYANWRLMVPLLTRLRRGDGHPVLVLPGFTAADRSTARLRLLLRRLGYRTYGWRLGANLGPTPHIIEGLEQRIAKIHNDNDGQRITLIGQSLGGVFSRLLARQEPELFRQVITLGSPFRMQPGDKSSVSHLWESLQHLHDDRFMQGLADRNRPPMPIPTTAIYSRTDGVVNWRLCLDKKGPISENVEVFGSHSGMSVNASVGYVIADRLAQPEQDWRRFRSPLWARAHFPRAADYRPI